MTNIEIKKDTLWHANSFETEMRCVEGLTELLACSSGDTQLPDETLSKVGEMFEMSLRRLRDHHEAIWEAYSEEKKNKPQQTCEEKTDWRKMHDDQLDHTRKAHKNITALQNEIGGLKYKMSMVGSELSKARNGIFPDYMREKLIDMLGTHRTYFDEMPKDVKEAA